MYVGILFYMPYLSILVWNTRYIKSCQLSSSANIIANLGNAILH